MDKLIKLIITGDHPVVLRGFENMLATYTDIKIIAAFSYGKQLLEWLTVHKPDIILLDILMPEMKGDDTMKK